MAAPFIPSFIIPSAPASLSNRFGSNLTNDKLSFSVKYSNPLGATDGPAALRYKTYRTPYGATAPILASDSFWLGTGNTQAYPTSGLPASLYPSGPSNCFVYRGRLYVFAEDTESPGSTSYNISAPLNGRNVGTWRQELSLPPAFSSPTVAGGHINGACVVNGYAYVAASGFDATGTLLIYYSFINADGTFSAWNSFTSPVTSGSGFINFIYGYSDLTGAYLGIFGSTLASFYGITLGADGSPGSNVWVTGSASGYPSPAHLNPGIVVVPSGSNDGKATLLLIGGDNSTTLAFATIIKSTLTAGVTGAFTTNTKNLPAVRTWACCCVSNGFIYVMGGAGSAASAEPWYANCTTSVYYNTIAGVVGDSVVWSTSGNTLPVAKLGAVCGGDSVLDPQVNNIATTGLPTIACGLGWGATTNWLGTVQSAVCNATSGVVGSFLSGGTTLLASADLNAGLVTANQDGTWTISWAYGSSAYQPGGASTLKIGDTVELDVQMVDLQGDISPVGTILFKVGAPPVITNVSPASAATVNNSVIPVSWVHNPSIADSPEWAWKVQLSRYIEIVRLDAPVGFWPLNDQAPGGFNDAVDIIAGRTAVASLTGVQCNLEGKIGAAFGFDGLSGSLTVATNPALHPGDTFSVECWFKTLSAATQMLMDSNVTSDWGLYLAGGKIIMSSHNIGTIGTSIKTYNDGLWHHVVWTKTGATNKLYVDGVDVTPPISNLTITAGVAAITFGFSVEAGGFYLAGAMDDIAIYNFVLTPAQVLAHYNASVPIYDSGVVAGQANSINISAAPALPNATYYLMIFSYGNDNEFPFTSTSDATSVTAFTISASAAGGGSGVGAIASP